MKTLSNYVNGELTKAGKSLPDYNPSTGQPLCFFPKSGVREVEEAVAADKKALPAWAATPVSQRVALLERIAAEIDRRAPELAQMEVEDAGETLHMASTVDVPRAAANFRFFARALAADTTEASVREGVVNYVSRGPVGVCGLITPWNLPLYLLSWKLAPALACGNTVVAKPSELTPRTASALADILHVCGVPPGVFNLVHGLGSEAGAALVAHPDVKCVSFTGGTATGALIAAAAAPRFAKLSLELGGKNSTLIFNDVPVERAVAAALKAGFTNNGQTSLAGSRVFVQRPLYDAFLPAFAAAVSALKVGPPLTPGTDVGPVSSAGHRDKVLAYVKLGVEEGGVVEAGGLDTPPGLPEENKGGYFVRPTVLSGLPPTSRVSTEEVFGPLVTLHAFETEDEVVAATNSTRYGLAGSIWTDNLTLAHRVARRVESGMLWVNCWMVRDLTTPFGGVKDSGVGREGGRHSLDFYSESRTCASPCRTREGNSAIDVRAHTWANVNILQMHL